MNHPAGGGEGKAVDEIHLLIIKFFNGRITRAMDWFDVVNPLLGNVTPNEMIKAGRAQRLLKWIKLTLAENEKEATREK